MRESKKRFVMPGKHLVKKKCPLLIVVHLNTADQQQVQGFLRQEVVKGADRMVKVSGKDYLLFLSVNASA